MELHFTGIIIAVSTFLIIGLFHPIVIKTNTTLAPATGGYFSFWD